MGGTLLEGGVDRVGQPLRVERFALDQDQQVDQVLDPRIGPLIPRPGVGVQLLRELLMDRERRESGRGDPGEGEEFGAGHLVRRLLQNVAHSGIEMELGEDPAGKPGLDRETRSPLRRRGERLVRCPDAELEKVAGIVRRRPLQRFVELADVAGADRPGLRDGGRDPEIKVLSDARFKVIPDLEYEAAFHDPRHGSLGKKASEQAVEGDQTPQPVELGPGPLGPGFQTRLQGLPECRRGGVGTDRSGHTGSSCAASSA